MFNWGSRSKPATKARGDAAEDAALAHLDVGLGQAERLGVFFDRQSLHVAQKKHDPMLFVELRQGVERGGAVGDGGPGVEVADLDRGLRVGSPVPDFSR